MAPLMRFRWHIPAALLAALVLVWAQNNKPVNTGLMSSYDQLSQMRARREKDGSIQPGTDLTTNKKDPLIDVFYSGDINKKHAIKIKNRGGPSLCVGGTEKRLKANSCPGTKSTLEKNPKRDANRVAYVQRRDDDDEDKWPDCDCDGKKKKCDCDCDCEEELKKAGCKDKPKRDYSHYPPDMLWTRIAGDCKKYPGSTLWQNGNDECMMKKGQYFVTADCNACDPDQLWQIQTTVVITKPPVTETVAAAPVTVTAEPETLTVTQDPVTETVTSVSTSVSTTVSTTTQVVQVTPTPTPTPTPACYVHTDCRTGYRCCNQWDNQCYPQCRSDYDCGAGYFCAANYWHCYPKNSQYYSGYYHH